METWQQGGSRYEFHQCWPHNREGVHPGDGGAFEQGHCEMDRGWDGVRHSQQREIAGQYIKIQAIRGDG